MCLSVVEKWNLEVVDVVSEFEFSDEEVERVY